MKNDKLVKLIWKRDESALPAMENEYGDYIFKLSLGILGNARDAEECLNETLLAAWNSIPPNCPEDLRTYLAKLARRISISRARKNYSQKRISSEAMVSLDELDDCLTVGLTLDEELDAERLAALIDRFLRSLDETERNVFMRRYWCSEKVVDIAKSYGFSEGKTKMMLQRTRNKLRKFLESEDIYV